MASAPSRNSVSPTDPPPFTTLLLCREGNKTPKKDPGPVVFVLKPQPHSVFHRRGPDLVHKVKLPLYQALAGASIEVKTLDSRFVRG